VLRAGPSSLFQYRMNARFCSKLLISNLLDSVTTGHTVTMDVPALYGTHGGGLRGVIGVQCREK